MAYFSNGSHGEHWESENCSICKYDDRDKGCSIMDVYMVFNYDQVSKGQEKLREALNILIPENDGYPIQCLMFSQIDGSNNDTP